MQPGTRLGRGVPNGKKTLSPPENDCPPPNAGNQLKNTPSLSGPVRDTPPYRAIPFRDSIADGGIAPICLVFIGYRASITEIPLLRGGLFAYKNGRFASSFPLLGIGLL